MREGLGRLGSMLFGQGNQDGQQQGLFTGALNNLPGTLSTMGKNISDPMFMAGIQMAAGVPSEKVLPQAYAAQREMAQAAQFQQQQELAKRQQAQEALQQQKLAQLGQNWEQFADDFRGLDFQGITNKLIASGLNPVEAVALGKDLLDMPIQMEGNRAKGLAEQQKALLTQEDRAMKMEDRELKLQDRIEDKESKLRDEFRKTTTRFNEMQDNFAKIEELRNSGKHTPVSDMQLVFSYMRMIQPGAQVSDREFERTEAARSIPATVMNLWSKVMNGQRITDDQREQLFDSAISAHNSFSKTRDLEMDNLKSIIEAQDLRENQIIGNVRDFRKESAEAQAENNAKRRSDAGAELRRRGLIK